MDSTVNADTAKTGIDAARPFAPAFPIAADCVAWERSHASTPVVTTGGVRLLPGTTGRLRTAGYSTSSFPSSGPSTQRPPV
jgi:hypothetical protein